MVLSSKRVALIPAFLLLVLSVPACKQKESREPEATADAAEQTQTYITTQNVNVRTGPGTRYKIVAEIKSGTQVNVAGREAGWLKVVSKQGNPPGYIDERFAKPAAQPTAHAATAVQGSYMTTADAYVREGPGLHYKALTKIEKGTKVNVVGEQGDWLKVQSRHGNPPGYIEKKYAERRPD